MLWGLTVDNTSSCQVAKWVWIAERSLSSTSLELDAAHRFFGLNQCCSTQTTGWEWCPRWSTIFASLHCTAPLAWICWRIGCGQRLHHHRARPSGLPWPDPPSTINTLFMQVLNVMFFSSQVGPAAMAMTCFKQIPNLGTSCHTFDFGSASASRQLHRKMMEKFKIHPGNRFVWCWKECGKEVLFSPVKSRETLLPCHQHLLPESLGVWQERS